jgi:signal transduction histidine kinase
MGRGSWSAASPSVEILVRVRERVLSHLRRVLIVGLPVVLIWMTWMHWRSGRVGVWADSYLVVMGIGYVSLFLARERAVALVVATFFIGLLMAFATGSGPTAGTVAALVWCVLALAVLKDWRAGALAAVAIAAVTLGVGLSAWHGTPVLLDGSVEVPFGLYARMGFAFMMVVSLVVLMMREVRRGLVEALADLDSRAAAERSERRAREAAEDKLSKAQRMELVGRLASGIAHDANNALTVIKASAELLQRSPTQAEREAIIADLVSATRTAEQTIATITAFSRARVAVPSVVRVSDAVGTFARTAQRVLPRGVRVEAECDSDAAIRIDRAGLDQALLNLALNARDAMPGGGVLSLRVLLRDDQRVVIEVSDTGTGMDEDTMAHIFEPFFTTKEEGQGTGLGLAMVRRTIDMAGGTVEVESHPGDGSRFRLVLPRAAEGASVGLDVG